MIQGSIDDANFASLTAQVQTADKNITAAETQAAADISAAVEAVKTQINDSIVALANTVSTTNSKTVDALEEISGQLAALTDAVNALNKED